MIDRPPVRAPGWARGLRPQLLLDLVGPGRGRAGWLERAVALSQTPGHGQGRSIAEIIVETEAHFRALDHGHGRG